MTSNHFRLSVFIQGRTVWSVICLTVVVGRVRRAARVHCSSLLIFTAPSKEDGQGTYLVTRTVGWTQLAQCSHGARLGPFCLSEMAQGSSLSFLTEIIYL